MTALLELSGISHSYRGAPALSGVSLKVGEGEMVGVVGPNGAGKTTLLRAAAGILHCDEGVVLINGENIRQLRAAQRASVIATVPQNPMVPEGFRVLDVVLMGRNPHLGLLQWEGKRDLEVALNAMEMTDTAQFADRMLSSLSGGERQRVFIARALAQEPQVLILDEPTAHLDLGYQVEVMETISGIRNRRGLAVLCAMHDVTLAAQYFERLVVLAAGLVRAEGRPADVVRPDLLSEVFNANVVIVPHPDRGSPVALVTGRSTDARGGRTTGPRG